MSTPELAKHLASMVTPKDASRYSQLLKDNERYLTIVLERIILKATREGYAAGQRAMQEQAAHHIDTSYSHWHDGQWIPSQPAIWDRQTEYGIEDVSAHIRALPIEPLPATSS